VAGNLASDVVAKAPPDGYTLLYTVSSSFTVNPWIYSKLPYDPEKDFRPVSPLLSQGAFIVANNDTNPTPPATLNASANGGAVVTSFNVRANDLPANAGTVTILSQSFTNGGAGANATVNAATQQIQWTTTVTAGTNAGRQAQRRGTYTVTYQLTNGTATAIATYTLKFT